MAAQKSDVEGWTTSARVRTTLAPARAAAVVSTATRLAA
jgi:hypothetical protein